MHLALIFVTCLHFLSSSLAQDGSLRLVGGGAYAGRVEIYFSGVWGTICDDNWDIQAARVVCKQLNYGQPISAPPSATFGEGEGPILLDDVRCQGIENLLVDCSSAGWRQNNCGHFEDASVVCTGPLTLGNNNTSVEPLRSSIRLVDGPSQYSGRVELLYQGEWGTICDDLWDINDGHVVCRQLGFSEASDVHNGADVYGAGEGPILLENVQCHGFESSIAACVHSQWRTHNCDHSEDAGVTCKDVGHVEEGAIRLVDGFTPNEGRVEVYHDYQWGTLCDDRWNMINAEVVCKQLGYAVAVSARKEGYFGKAARDQQVWIDELNCYGNETQVSECARSAWGIHDCGHDEDAGVVCGGVVPTGNTTTYPYPVRLVNGNRPEEGRLEVYHNGQWGTVCDYDWDIENANVACRQMGFDGAVAAKGNAYFGEGSGYIMLDRVKCQGNEQVLAECQTSAWYDHRCRHIQDAGVICATEPGQLAPIRLTGGEGPFEGRLELFHNGEWSTVCDDEFEVSEAKVACKQLGYASGVPVTDGRFGEGVHRIALDEVNCRGDETSLAACYHNAWYRHDCSHSEDVGVICDTTDIREVAYAHVRLQGGSAPNEGRLEVYHDGAWGSVCDDSWDINDANVVCRQLGYASAIEGAPASLRERFGAGFGQIFLDDVKCSGMEDSLGSCPSGGWYNHNCDHSEDVVVVCNVDQASVATRTPRTHTAPVRLVGGVTANEGRVEVYYRGEWGTICDDSWDITDAHVVCHQLGYNEAVAVRSGAPFSSGSEASGPILMDDVDCQGFESSISMCTFSGWYDTNCLHEEDVGVVCSNVRLAGYASVRLAGGSYPYEGRVEIYHDGHWGSVCDNSWDISDATVVCNQLGYFSAVSAPHGALYGQGSGEIMLNNVGCHGWESSLSSCAHTGWYSNNDCSHRQDAGVVCWHYTMGATIETEPVAGNNVFLPVRLSGGRIPSEGRVEMLYDDVWGTVCDDGWDLNDAEVVCRQLGYPGALEFKNAAYFGRGQGHILLSQMGCEGNEDNIGQCQHSDWYYQYCNHFEDAGVVCKTSSSSETDPLNQIRLVGGSGRHEGRIEVHDVLSGDWGTVCDDGWGLDEAEVACRQLGFNSAKEATTKARFGQGTGAILYSNFKCWGYEPTLAACDHSRWREQISCYHGEDAGVVCSHDYGEYNGRIRLVNGATAYEGRVEIYFNGVWGSVCDDSWDINAANVVCKQLGYGIALDAKDGAYYGQTNGPIHMDDFFCYGNELDLANCNHPEWGTNDCNHAEDSGVICSKAREITTDNGLSVGAVAGILMAVVIGLAAMVVLISLSMCHKKGKELHSMSSSDPSTLSSVSSNVQNNDYAPEADDNPVTVYTLVPPRHRPPYTLQTNESSYFMHRHSPPPYQTEQSFECRPQCYQLPPQHCELGQQSLVSSAEHLSLVPSEPPSYSPNPGGHIMTDATNQRVCFSKTNKRPLKDTTLYC